MKHKLKLTLVLLIALVAAPSAQQVVNVSDNANILPIYKSTPPGVPPAPGDYLRGNLLGQRCNEPSIGISTLNSNHVMIFCNDYRATFNFDDALVPSGKTTLVAAVWNGVKTFLARMVGKPPAASAERKIAASTEAGIGGGVTYDGGLTWQGFMVPGGPNDSTPASLTHPGKGLMQGYSDPTAVSMKDGRVGIAYIGFNRDPGSGNPSGIFFSVYRDRNASDVAHDWEYEGSWPVQVSNNLSQGQFLDKVAAAVAGDCVYISYTRFTGSAGSSNIYLAKSCDVGRTWSVTAIDKDAKYGQGTVALVNPTDSAKVGVLWRTFVSNSLIFKSTAKNAKNVNLFATELQGYLPFDQYSQSIVDPSTSLDSKQRGAFRALAFPDAAYTPDGKVLVAVFTEWIDLNTGMPSTAGRSMPMVVMKYSIDNGATWSQRLVLNWQNGEEDTIPAAPERLGFFSPARPVGAQSQPAIACAPGSVCAVVWKQDFGDMPLSAGGPENNGAPVMAAFDRRSDVRGVTVKFQNTALTGVSPSYQVSRYGYKEPGPTDTPADVDDTDEWVAKMTLPNGTSYAIRNNDNLNHTGGGLIPFVGDYLAIENTTAPGAAPSFMVAFTDNRYNIRPWQKNAIEKVPQGEEFKYYRVFQAPTAQQPLSCLNYGSRVQSVMAARINAGGLLLSAQINHKPFQTDQSPPRCGTGNQKCIEFPLTIWNTTGQHLKDSTAVTLALSSGSFAKRPYDPALDGTDPGDSYTYPLVQGSVEIYPYGSYSTVVYAFSGAPVTVTATTPGTNPATITFNDPNVVNASAATSFEYVPSKVNIESGSARSGSARSGSARSGSARSGSARSYPVPEDPVPGKTVYDVIDQTYVVTPGSTDDAGTYLSLFNIDPAYEGNYVFQVFVTKPLTSFMTEQGELCSAFNWTEGALVGHISDPDNPLVSGSARSGSARSGSARSGSARSAIPSDGDPLVQNTAFTLASSTVVPSAEISGASTQVTAAAAGSGCLIDECTLAAPRLPNEVTILVRAYQVTPTANIPVELRYDPDGSLTGTPTPPSVVVAEYACDDPSCTASLGPDLEVQTDPAPTPVSPRRVRAGSQVEFPTLSIKNVGVDGQCGTEAVPKPCGEARSHQWAVYASTEADFEKVPRYEGVPGQISGTVKENTNPSLGPVTVLLKTGAHDKLACVPTAPDNPTCNGATELAAVGSVTIPASIPRTNADGTGTYYLHFYDDRGRVVNELDETNNDWSDGPIIVEAGAFGFLGLQTPCTGMTCDKTGAVVLAWQFTNGSVPVDSASTLPRVKFYDSCPAPVDANGYPTGAVKATTSPNPADITSGASGWQYFPNTGMTRPQYTWQFNFDATGLARGSCYSMYIEIPATGQVIGSTNPEFRPIGPLFITPR